MTNKSIFVRLSPEVHDSLQLLADDVISKTGVRRYGKASVAATLIEQGLAAKKAEVRKLRRRRAK